MKLWPNTPRSLLTRLADLESREKEAEWSRFVELYTPAIGRFVRLQEPRIQDVDVEDVAQEILAKLVPVLQEQRFDPKKAKFSTYLSTIVENHLTDRRRRLEVRRDRDQVPLTPDMEILAPVPDPAAMADINWRLARHQAAVQHVFTRSALSEQSRQVYLMSEVEGLSAKEIGARLGGMSANVVRVIRSRVAKMIAAVESQFD